MKNENEFVLYIKKSAKKTERVQRQQIGYATATELEGMTK